MKKNSKFFTAEFIEEIFEKIFTVNCIEKNFKNFLWIGFIKKKFEKFLMVNFRLLKIFLLLNSFKKFWKFLQSISLKKISKVFQKIRKKNFFHKKKGVTWGDENPDNFSRKIRHDLSLGFDILSFFFLVHGKWSYFFGVNY